MGLRTARDPQAATRLLVALAAAGKRDPTPPELHTLVFGTHPPILDRIAMAEAFELGVVVGLGEVLILRGRVARPRVLHRVDQLAGELRRHVDPRNDDSGNVALLDLVVDA